MKIRNGFVSNSSSSSFIVYDPDRTTSQIMREMLKIVKSEWKEFKHNKKDISYISKCIKWLQYHPKKDTPIMFPRTCNYETWVFKNKDSIDTLIETCNNHDWYGMEFDYRSAEERKEDWIYLKTLKFLDLSDMKEKTYDEYNKEWEDRLTNEVKQRSKK